MMQRATSISFGLLLALIASPAMSHHGNTEYNLSEEVRYEGTVVEYIWRNPHSFITLETQTESGEAITLEIEGGSPSSMRTYGFAADSIVPGEHVVAIVSPSRRFPKESAYGYEIIKDDGSSVALISARARRQQSNQVASDMYTTWVPADGFRPLVRSMGSWALTDKGQERFDSYSSVMTPQARCIPASAPWLMAYAVVFEFERLSDRINITSDWMGARRTIYLDNRNHPAPDERFQQGHSTGRFENDLLIVDTTNFSDQVFGRIASGGEKHLIEYFELSDDGKSIGYRFELEDPEFMAEQISQEFQMGYRPDLELSGMECDLELAERFLREFQ